MLDEHALIPFLNDERTHLCQDPTWGTYWVYSPTVGRMFPVSYSPEGAWKNFYTVLAYMSIDQDIKAIFTRAAQDNQDWIDAHEKEVRVESPRCVRV